jgi:transposase InsO family protein
MRIARIEGVRLRRRRPAPPPGEVDAATVPDRLGRDFTAMALNERYVGEIAYLPVEGGSFLSPATVIDLYRRRLTGWAIADHMRTDLVETALRRAQIGRGGLSGTITHTDIRVHPFHTVPQRTGCAAIAGASRLLGRRRSHRIVRRRPQT